MKIDDLVSPCRCGCLRLVHVGSAGPCTSCKCVEFQVDDTDYPIGHVITS